MSDTMNKPTTLSTHGLPVPPGFPAVPYERVHSIIATRRGTHPLYEHYGGAWNAMAYRYRACLDSGDRFIELLRTQGSTPPPDERYQQEKYLFDFFNNGFSAFECTFYALYTFGAMLEKSVFSLATERDQQKVTPSRTKDAFVSAFPANPLTNELTALIGDGSFQKFREIRNILTHRTAPGRRIYVSIGDDDLPTEWKLTGSPLDASIVGNGKQDLERLLTSLLSASAIFVASEFNNTTYGN